MAKVVRVPDYDASDRQTKFHTSPAFETLYGGAAGGGKTAALVGEAITYALQYPKSRTYVFRRTTPELKQSVVPEFFKQTADYMNIAKGVKYNSQDSVFIFTNGSIVQLAYLESPADMYRYQSAEIHLLLIDELTHFTKDQYEFLKTRVRTSMKNPLKVMAATNPGGIGHAWVKSYFIDTAPPETIYTDDLGNTRIFIPAKVTDHISAEFIASYSKVLNAISDPNLRRAMRDGDWDIFAGQAFEEWKREKDGKPWHVITPFAVPTHWTRWMAYDYGYNTWAAAVWAAIDPVTNRIYIYREFYESKMVIGKQAEVMKMMESGETITMHLADPSIWKAVGNAETGELIAKVFQNHSMIFQPANNDRKAGKAAFHEALAIQADGFPRLVVFSSCTNFIRTVPNLPVDINRPEDIDCFVAGTRIRTAGGYKYVENIRDGELVATPLGLRRAFIARAPHRDSVVTIELSNGKTLTGNLKHKIFVRGKGLVPLCELQCHDILETWNTSSLKNISPLLLMVSSLENTLQNAITNRQATPYKPAVTPTSTVKSGSRLMAQFQLAIMSTIKTIIRTIMTLLILSYKKKVDTPFYTTRVGSRQENCRITTSNGVSPQLAEQSYEPIWKSVAKEVWHGNFRAFIVGSLLTPRPAPRNIVQKHAPTLLGAKRTPALASAADRPSFIKTSTAAKPVHIVAVGNYDERTVYPLRVEQAGLYYANGVLVCNTRAEDHIYDAARYLLMNQRPSGTVEPNIDQSKVDARNRYVGRR